MQESTRDRSKLRVEQLEDRCVPAGNVFAAMIGHNLVVLGDAEANGILLLQTEQGVEVRGDIETTVNGGESFTAVGLTKDVIVALGGGNDNLSAAFNAPRGLAIDMGAGDDGVGLGGLFDLPLGATQGHMHVAGNLVVLTGDGNDFFGVLESQVEGHSLVSLGQGDDVLFAFHSTFDNGTVILGGAGMDTLDISFTTFGGPTAIWTGGGDDFLSLTGSTFGSLADLDGGAGFDTLVEAGNQFAITPQPRGFEA